MTASELLLTGIAASGETVRAFFSEGRGGSSVFSLNLHEEYAGIRFEGINRRARQVWIVESGSGRWLGLGDSKSHPSLPPANPSGFENGSSTVYPSAVAPGPVPIRGLAVAELNPETGAGPVPPNQLEAIPGDAGGASPPTPHRWKHGVVREPNAAELYRARNGAAALDAAIRIGQVGTE